MLILTSMCNNIPREQEAEETRKEEAGGEERANINLPN